MKTMKTKGYKKGGAMKTKGYAKGGALKMVEKDGKKVPFYAADGKGKMAEGGEVKPMKGMGNMPLDDEQAAAAIKNLKKQKEAKKKAMKGRDKDGNKISRSFNEAEAKKKDGKKEKPFMGAMQRQDPKPKRKLKKGETRAKAGGMMKTKGYAKGGKVRGAGIAKQGVRKCKMR